MNDVICGNCVDIMQEFPDEYVDLVVTSPPYDNLRNYNGYTFNFESVAKELARVLKVGRILIWVVSDQTKNFCESLTSFKQSIYFVEQCNLKLLDTMTYNKKNVPPTYPNMKRYAPSFEFMFIFSKGKPLVFNAIKDRKNKYGGVEKSGDTQRQKDGTTKNVRGYVPKEYGARFNYWIYDVGKNKDTKDVIALKHPARFPEQLAHDLIVSWSNEGDLVLDPMCGSGTTLKMAKQLGRKYIGIDISQEYCGISKERLALQDEKEAS